jgi:EAL domain-containing protein (putative c-di-GMP-specific phosphodiesterase class I)
LQIPLENGRIPPPVDFIKAARNKGLIYQLECLLMKRGLAAAEVHGYEARLVRQHPTRGIIAPEFPPCSLRY